MVRPPRHRPPTAPTPGQQLRLTFREPRCVTELRHAALELNLCPQGLLQHSQERTLVWPACSVLSLPQKAQGLVRCEVWALTQHSCSRSLKALYAGMNSFSHGDLKALLTKWVTFLGIFIRLVRFCHARQLLWNFRFDITRIQCGILASEL